MNCVTIDGIIFSLQTHGGISVYFRELLRYLGTQNLGSTLLLEEPLMQTVDQSGIGIIRRHSRIAERVRKCRLPASAKIFHSSYYRRPGRADCASIVTVHDFISEQYRTGYRAAAHRMQKYAAIQAADVIICVSEATRRDLYNRIDIRAHQEVCVIHNGVGDGFHQTESYGSPERPYMLFVGQRKGYKNFDLAVRSLELLPDMNLICIGGGPLEAGEIDKFPQSVRSRISFCGYVSDDKLNRYYNLAACLVYPSQYEGFGVPVVEAMKAGCPVVCVDCAAVLEVGGDAVIKADAIDPEAIASAVERALGAQNRASWGHKGMAQAAAYSWCITHAQTAGIYRSLFRRRTQ